MSETEDGDRESLRGAVNDLPEAEKLVATLVWFEGLSLDEVAERLDVSSENAAEVYERAVTRFVRLRGSGPPEGCPRKRRPRIGAA